jgi:predicted transcriptional regulator
MTEAVTVTLSPELVRKLDEFKLEEDSSYEEVISRVLEYFMDADNYVTGEERQEILVALADVEAGNYYTSEEVDAMLRAKIG